MLSILILVLVISFAIEAILANIVASQLEAAINERTESWSNLKRLGVIALVWAIIWLPTAYIAYQEFRPSGAGTPQTPFWVVVLSVILLFIASSVVLFRYTPIRYRKRFYIVVAAITMIVIIGLLYYRRSVLAELRTVYIVLDASQNTEHTFTEIRPRIQLEAQRVPEQVDIGLAAFGAGLNGQNDCEDIIEFVSPAHKETSIPQIQTTLSLLDEITPYGKGGLQYALSFAINRLEGRQGVHQVFVVTSGIDKQCGNLNRAEINELGTKLGVDFELIIVTVGTINENERIELEAYADRYKHLGDAENLPETIQDIINSPPLVYQAYDYNADP